MNSRKSALQYLSAATAVALAACAAASTGATRPADSTLRNVTGGQVRGADLGDVIAFKGIPFAAPPVGVNRWREPQPVVAWDGMHATTEFAPPCKQDPKYLDKGVKDSEDCLYLNIWRPASAGDKPLPVMVWFHGGSFISGAPSASWFDGVAFARRGVVIVTVGFRLGIFGFLAHPELSAESGHGSGNFSLQDQIASLKWVRDNIAAFGGDPHNVTIFGESSGAHSVSIMAASPQAHGLFHRAISQSGGMFAPIPRGPDEFAILMVRLSDAEQAGVATLRALGANNLAAARSLAADRVLASPAVFLPVVDRYIIVGDQYELYSQGRYNHTPVLLGSNADEGSVFMPQITPAAFAQLTHGFGDRADEILTAYPHATDAERLASARNFMREGYFAWPTWTWARLQSRNPGSEAIYAYYFDYDAPGQFGPSFAGPIHAGELPYVFGNWISHPTAQQAAVSNTMMSYWVNFARTGNPNGPGLPPWPAFKPGSEQMMRINTAPAAGPTPNLPQLQAMDDYFAWRRSQQFH